ncbi:unnamed protein product [Parajaminaea phylloscopi]
MASLARTVLARSRVAARRPAGIRHYAQPVGATTSLDARLGIAAPPPPRPWDPDMDTKAGNSSEDSFLVHPRPGNPNDLSELLRSTAPATASKASSSSSPSASGSRSATKATLQSVKGTAIAQAHRRAATGVPTDDLPLMPGEDAQSPSASIGSAPIDREHPHSIDSLSGRNELDERVLQAARAVYASGKGASLSKLSTLFEQEAGRVLPIELPYESAPSHDRRVLIPQRPSPAARATTQTPPELTDDDGVLLLAYIDDVSAPRGLEKISVCTGFAIEGGDELAAYERAESGTPSVDDGADQPGHLVVTVAHTLRGAQSASSKAGSAKATPDRSAAVAITRNGDVYPVQTVLSSLPSADLLLLRIAKDPLPIVRDADGAAQPAKQTGRIKTLPVSPYPSATDAHLLVSSFWGFEDDSSCALPPFTFSASDSPSSSSSATPYLRVQKEEPNYPPGREADVVRREGDAMSQSRWGEVRLVEYKDGKGSEAQRGTYDSLETMEYKLVADSPINPQILRGNELAFVPGLGATHDVQAYGSQGSTASSTATGPSPPTIASTLSSPHRGAGGYGVPNFPPPGSSGGPIVDYETGAVVGVTRGCKMSSLGGRRGEGIPSEKICEFFTLPGLGKKPKPSK